MGQHDVLRISLGLLGYPLILFENQIQTTSASPCHTQVQPAASFLVCSLIFIEYKNRFSQFKEKKDKFLSILTSLAGTALVLAAIWLGWTK